MQPLKYHDPFAVSLERLASQAFGVPEEMRKVVLDEWKRIDAQAPKKKKFKLPDKAFCPLDRKRKSTKAMKKAKRVSTKTKKVRVVTVD